jgi:hypothetical protein
MHATAHGLMSKGEREDLQRLIRQREKVLKSAAKQRSAEMLAEFENQMGQVYSFDQDEVWARAAAAANHVVKQCQAQVAARCRELGIPDRFAPSLGLEWHHRGYDNLLVKRRTELRRMAETRIEAEERKAITAIEMSCLNAQEKLAVSGLSSDAAKQFIEQLPSIETLMPALSFEAIAGPDDMPVAEKLVSPAALRQRRHRARLRDQRDSDVTDVTPTDGDEENL